MKTLLALIILTLGLSSQTLAQKANNTYTKQQLKNLATGRRGAGIHQRRGVVYKGSPYFTDWKKGYLLINKESKSQPIYLRYDMHNNQVEFLRNKKIFVVPAKKINGFKIKASDRDILFMNGFKTNQKHISSQTLLRVIYNGNVKLLANHYSTLMKDVASVGNANKVNKYSNGTDYLLRNPDGKFHKVDLDENDILDAIGNNKQVLKEYAHQHNLDFSDEADLRKILSHYDKISTTDQDKN